MFRYILFYQKNYNILDINIKIQKKIIISKNIIQSINEYTFLNCLFIIPKRNYIYSDYTEKSEKIGKYERK